MRVLGAWLLCCLVVCLLGATALAQGSAPGAAPGQPPAQSPPSAGSGAAAAQSLASQLSDPGAPLTYVQFRNVLLPSVSGTDGATYTLQVQPVLPIGREHDLPFHQLLKVNFALVAALPGPVNETGVGDLGVFDLVSVKTSWGRWGFGPALVFPTASSRALGAGKWQAGPAVALIYTGIKNLTLGAILQNPASFAGDASRPNVNSLIITPSVTLNLQEGWFVGLSDYNTSFNWENSGAATVLLGVQVGKILRIDKHPLSLSVEAGGSVARPGGTPAPGWIFGIEVTPIFKWHLGNETR